MAAAAMVTVRAGSFGVSPVRVHLGPAQTIAAVTISNDGETPLPIQVTSQQWSQPEGHDRLTPSHDVIVSPPLFSVAPHASQIVRIAMRGGAPSGVESCERLVFRELAEASGAAGVHLLLSVSIPLFDTPSAASPPELRWTASRRGDAVVLEVADPGGRHVEITHLRVELDGATLADRDMLLYLLPGSHRRLVLPLQGRMPGPAAQLRVSARTDAPAPLERVDATVRVDPS